MVREILFQGGTIDDQRVEDRPDWYVLRADLHLSEGRVKRVSVKVWPGSEEEISRKAAEWADNYYGMQRKAFGQNTSNFSLEDASCQKAQKLGVVAKIEFL